MLNICYIYRPLRGLFGFTVYLYQLMPEMTPAFKPFTLATSETGRNWGKLTLSKTSGTVTRDRDVTVI